MFSKSKQPSKPAPPAVGMDDDGEDLRLDDINTKVWLVKIPKFLAEKWGDIDEENVDLGKVRIYDRPDAQGNSISILLSDAPINDDLPREYTLKLVNNQVKNMYVFSEDAQTHQTAMAGTVHHECAVTPVYTEEYRRIMRTRNLEAGKPSRTVKVLGDGYKKALLSTTPGMRDLAAPYRKKGAHLDAKTTRMPKQELMNLLFQAFEKYPYWSFKGLVEFTQQPAAFLKETLYEVAVLNKKGQFNAMYQLKPEFSFKHGDGADPAAPTEGTDDTGAAGDGAEAGGDDDDKDMSEDDFEEV
ncbi:hypothetical protein IWQ60_010672 [Tieghemiomyces parasiticus]|uniref:Transcription initiation factor IIF subunit beta n=1 Tax=Tieghemiomyces parasiticus TaxID=78921 RepID=A0A9W7ZL39_9FUNG|nr:hypothetical protein IWQ60_010672 [Tieghemiomyces parasiticus]